MTRLVFTILNKDQLLARMRTRADDVGEKLLETLEVEMNRTRDWSKKNYFITTPGAPVPNTLHRRSGTLSSNITADATFDGRTLTGSIGVSQSAVPYARIHEFGGTVTARSHMRRVGYNSRLQRVKLLNKNGSVRAQVMNKGAMSRHRVGARTYEMPARPYLRPAMEDRQDMILKALAEKLMRVLA